MAQAVDKNSLPVVDVDNIQPRGDYLEVSGGTVVGSTNEQGGPLAFDPDKPRTPVVIDMSEYIANNLPIPLPDEIAKWRSPPAVEAKSAKSTKSANATVQPTPAVKPAAKRLAPMPASDPVAPPEIVLPVDVISPTDYEDLGWPWLGREKPSEPQVQVIFEFPGRGQMATFYHYVNVGPISIMLVWDNRFKGSQFVPQSDGRETLIVAVPSLAGRWKTRAMGIEHVLGVFDFIIILLEPAAEEAVPPDSELGPEEEIKWP